MSLSPPGAPLPVPRVPPRNPTSPVKRIAAIAAGPVLLLLLVVGIALYSSFAPPRLRVYMLNGLTQPYAVTVNGTEVTLPPGQFVPLENPRGTIAVTVNDAALDFTGLTYTPTRGMLSMFSPGKLVVLNPDRLGAITEQRQMTLGDQTQDFDAGSQLNKDVHEFDGSVGLNEYPKVSRPRGRRNSNPLTTNVPRRIVVDKAPYRFSPIHAIEAEQGKQAVRAYVERVLRHFPDETNTLGTLHRVLDVPDYLELIRPFLEARPVKLDVHLAYLDLMKEKQPQRDLAAEYQLLAEQEPQIGDLYYLAAMANDNVTLSNSLLVKATQATTPSHDAFAKISERLLSRAMFPQALDYARRAVALNAQSPKGRAALLEALRANREYDELLQLLKAPPVAEDDSTGAYGSALPPGAYSFDVIREMVGILATTKRRDEAEKLIDEQMALYAAKNPKAKLYNRDGYWDKSLRQHILQVEGRMQEYYAEMAKEEYSQYSFDLALFRGDFAKALENWDDSPEELLLVYVLASQANKQAEATDALKQAIDDMKHYDPYYKVVIAVLESNTVPDIKKLSELDLTPQDKAVALLAIGTYYPTIRKDALELAEKLNYTQEYPHQFVRLGIQRGLAR